MLQISFSASNKKSHFQLTRVFSGLYCEQMETDLKKPPHGFSPERIHLSLLGNISPECDGFEEIFGIL